MLSSFVPLLLITSFHVLGAPAVMDRPCETHLLSAEQLSALRDGKAFYPSKILSGVVDGKQRTLVIVGETHYSGPLDQGTGVHILASFPAQAKEGMNLSNYWFSDMQSRVFERISTTAKNDKEAPQPGLLIQAVTHQLAADFARDIHDGKTNLEQVKAALYNLERARLKGLQVDSSWVDYRQLYEEIAAAVASTKKSNESRQYEFFLEKDHRPPLHEQIAALIAMVGIQLHFTKAAFLLMLSGSATLAYVSSALPSPLSIGGITLGAVCGAVTVATAAIQNLSVITRCMDVSVAARNATMARNILQIFEDHPDIGVLLVIAGKAHLAGLVPLLAPTFHPEQSEDM
jgi:hypothetical protein